MANKFLNNILHFVGYVPKSSQTIINIPQRDIISDATSSNTGFIKATSAKLVLALKKVTQQRQLGLDSKV